MVAASACRAPVFGPLDTVLMIIPSLMVNAATDQIEDLMGRRSNAEWL
jgi:hypothetical protein